MEKTTETKAADQIKVLAGTFSASCGDQAMKLAAGLKDAKIEGFAVKSAANMPGYIQVIAECKDEKAAEALIKAGADKKIKLCIAK